MRSCNEPWMGIGSATMMHNRIRGSVNAALRLLSEFVIKNWSRRCISFKVITPKPAYTPHFSSLRLLAHLTPKKIPFWKTIFFKETIAAVDGYFADQPEKHYRNKIHKIRRVD